MKYYFRLPQDVYQTAKVSKLLLAISSGKSQHLKGKTLEEIELSDSSDSDLETNRCNTNSSEIITHSKSLLPSNDLEQVESKENISIVPEESRHVQTTSKYTYVNKFGNL